MIENNDYDIAKIKIKITGRTSSRCAVLHWNIPNAVVNNNLQPEHKMRIFNFSLIIRLRLYFGILAADNKNIYFQIFCVYRLTFIDSTLRSINL